MSNKLIAIITAAVILILGGTVFLMDVTYDNRDVDLRNAAAAKIEANKARYDEVWKTIKQVAGVTDKYSSDFKEIYNGIMAGRYEADGKQNPMFKWISEQNPQLDSAMYTKLANTITAQRAGFTRDQQKLIDIKREHDNLRLKFPSKFFVENSELEIVVVTSGKTKETFATGEENDIELF
jgi:hypothetical protein